MPRVTDWAGISKRDGGFYCKVEVRPLPAKGKRFKAGTPLTVMQTWRDEVRRGLEARRDRRARYGTGTLADDVTRYFTLWGDDQHRETVAQRRRHLEAWVAAFPGRTRESLTTGEIEAQLAAWQRQPPETAHRTGARRQTSEGPATWAKRRQALLQLFAVLGRGTDLHNPVEDVPTRTQPAAQARGLLPYPVIRDLLATIPRSATRARLGVMAFTGLRPEELRRVEPADIDLAHATLYARTAKGGTVATVPLVPEAVTWLRELAVRRPYRPTTGRVVMRDGYGSFTAAPMNQALRRGVARLNAARQAQRLAPLTGVTAYSMRHSYGTALYRATRDLKTVAEGMRNSLAMAERYVEGAVSEVLERGVARLAADLAATQTATQTVTHGRGEVEETGGNGEVTMAPDRPDETGTGPGIRRRSAKKR